MRADVEIHRHSSTYAWTFGRLLEREAEIAQEVLDAKRQGALLFSELAPVVTLGRRVLNESELTESRESLRSRGVSVMQAPRGGLGTYHGPGQWVLFPVLPVAALSGGDPKGVRKVVTKLLDSVVQTAQAFGVEAECRTGGEAGVWTARGKLASIGLAFRQGLVRHGIALNVFPTPESFAGVRVCGFEGVKPDFLFDSAEGVRRFEEVRERWSEGLRSSL